LSLSWPFLFFASLRLCARSSLPFNRRSAALAAALALALLAGCTSTGPVELWPLYRAERNPGGSEQGDPATRTYEALYPFFSARNTPETRYHALRPLYNWEAATDGSFRQCQFLWPLGLYRYREDREKTFRILPLFHQGSARSTVNDQWQTRGFVFPLIIWGQARPGGCYFAAFPLGGVVRNLVVDRFRFVLFPIWSQVNDKDYSRHDVLWPVISWGGTPDGRRRILRLWPFYVHKRKTGEWERNWILWPFVLWGREALDTRYPRSYAGLFPLYVGKVSRDLEGETVAYDRRVLYFLFVRRKDTRPEHKLSAVAILWPLTNFECGPGRREIRIFPLYWQTDRISPDDTGYLWSRHRILWPIIWIDRDRRPLDHTARDIVVAPFYWDHAREWNDLSREREITLWPLYTFKRDRDGGVHHWLMSFGWHDVTKGWKRNLRAFFDIFQYHSETDGSGSVRLFWRLFSTEHHGPWRRTEINPLFTWERDEGYRRWSCLFGIIAREKAGQKRRWRIFYIPFGDAIERKER
jgi:hypothetical protein